MKSNFTQRLLIAFLFITFCNLTAQNSNTTPKGGEFIFNKNKTPCLTIEQSNNIKTMLKNNILMLKSQNRLAYSNTNRRSSHVLLGWPIKKKDGFSYNDVWSISFYADHNSAFPNQIIDYDCGVKTYDTNSGFNHPGVDIFNWPFGWRMMDNNEVEVVAAADGQIIAKDDGEFDRNCAFNNNPWNAIFIRHNDGSTAWYGHIKNGSFTAKNVGDMVVQGEFLGIAGSSGSSTGPHLHFEVYTDDTFTQLVDPYAGPCNSLNTDSWWQNQKPYINPNINAVLTHSAPPVFNTCPTTETTNESNEFDFSDTIYFGLYMRDQVAGTSINLKIIRPDNSELNNWDFNFTANYTASWWYWFFYGVYDMNGEWKWEATYQGQTVTHTFNVTGVLSVDENDFNTTSIYPNPFNSEVNIISNSKITKARIVDVLGKTVLSIKNFNEGINKLNLENLSNGMYFLTLEGKANQKKNIKLIKE